MKKKRVKPEQIHNETSCFRVKLYYVLFSFLSLNKHVRMDMQNNWTV